MLGRSCYTPYCPMENNVGPYNQLVSEQCSIETDFAYRSIDSSSPLIKTQQQKDKTNLDCIVAPSSDDCRASVWRG